MIAAAVNDFLHLIHVSISFIQKIPERRVAGVFRIRITPGDAHVIDLLLRFVFGRKHRKSIFVDTSYDGRELIASHAITAAIDLRTEASRNAVERQVQPI